MSRIRTWINAHPEVSVIAAQAGVVTVAVFMGLGLSRTFRADAHAHVIKANQEIADLKEENLRLYRIIDRAVELDYSQEIELDYFK